MIDLDHGQISWEMFVSPDLFRDKLETLFTRAWLFLGHESQIPNPGDFLVSRMSSEPVILCRDHAGVARVFLNSCRHRGMKISHYEQGNTFLFVCPYRSWRDTTDGRRPGVPLFHMLSDRALNRDEWSLIEIAKPAHDKDTVWTS